MQSQSWCLIILPSLLQQSSYKDGKFLVHILLLQSGYLLFCRNSVVQCCCIKPAIILLFSTRSVRPWRPAGWRSIRRQVPRLDTDKIREESFYKRPDGPGSGGRGPHQGGDAWRVHVVSKKMCGMPMMWSVWLTLFQAPEGESQPMTEVDLFISTQRIKVLSADTQVCLTNFPKNLVVPFFILSFFWSSFKGRYLFSGQ